MKRKKGRSLSIQSPIGCTQHSIYRYKERVMGQTRKRLPNHDIEPMIRALYKRATKIEEFHNTSFFEVFWGGNGKAGQRYVLVVRPSKENPKGVTVITILTRAMYDNSRQRYEQNGRDFEFCSEEEVANTIDPKAIYA